MSGKRRYGRPDRASLLAMMAVNGALALVVMTMALALFGVSDVLPNSNVAAMLHIQRTTPWALIWPMLPGAAVTFGCLWYWLIVIGRSRGIPWGGAAVYGLIIALVNVLIAGLIYGLINGIEPILEMLIFLALLLLVPAWLLAVTTFGLIMGVLNGYAAQAWIAWNRR